MKGEYISILITLLCCIWSPLENNKHLQYTQRDRHGSAKISTKLKTNRHLEDAMFFKPKQINELIRPFPQSDSHE